MCDDFISLPFYSLDIMSFEIMIRNIILVACFDRCIISPESVIASVFLLGAFGGVPI